MTSLSITPTERSNIAAEALRVALAGLQSRIWTAMPAIVQSVSLGAGGRMTAKLQPAVQAQITGADGSTQNVNLPILTDVLLVFPGGGGFTLTFPVQQGDEALVIFARNCIDGWWQSGQVSPQPELRMHSLSDGFALVGVRSVPRLLGNVSSENVQLRSDDGSSVFEMTPAGAVNITAPVSINLTAPAIVLNGGIELNGTVTGEGGTGDVVIDAAITATGEGTFNGIKVSDHGHPQGNDGHGDHEQDTGAPFNL